MVESRACAIAPQAQQRAASSLEHGPRAVHRVLGELTPDAAADVPLALVHLLEDLLEALNEDAVRHLLPFFLQAPELRAIRVEELVDVRCGRVELAQPAPGASRRDGPRLGRRELLCL